MADVGASTTAQVVGKLEEEATSGEHRGRPGADRAAHRAARRASRGRQEDSRIDLRHEPAVIMVCGVNGTGKTTTIGKLAWHLREELGQTVLLGAADTFRAAAVEQLEEWARRAGCEFVKGAPDSDPGSVAFDAVKRGRELGVDVVIVDTAGRLHTQDELMAELTKIRRVIERQMPDAPHETLLTVDATTGQNGLRQAKLFSRGRRRSTGIVLTKLDGTAKGGIALAIAGELGMPVKLIGIGESLEDLRPFDADDFAQGAAGRRRLELKLWTLCGSGGSSPLSRSPWARWRSWASSSRRSPAARSSRRSSASPARARSRRSSRSSVVTALLFLVRAAGRAAPSAPAAADPHRHRGAGRAARRSCSSGSPTTRASAASRSTARCGRRAPTTRTRSSRPASACRSSRSGARPRS